MMNFFFKNLLIFNFISFMYFGVVFASTNEISAVFDEYQYTMDGWDGADLSIQIEANKRLHEQLGILVDSGETLQAIQNTLEQRILNPSRKIEYRSLLSSLEAQNLSSDQITSAAINFMLASTGPTGSSFLAQGGGQTNYKKIAIIAGAVLVVAITIYLVKKRCKKHPKDDTPEPICYAFYMNGDCYRYY